MRKRNGLLGWMLVTCMALLAIAGAEPLSFAKKPNIVFFLVDDMGWQETSVAFHSGRTALNERDHTMTWHFPHHHGQTPFSSIRKGPWKLIHHHADRRLELFNLDADPGERNDLAAQEPGKRSGLAQALGKRLRELHAQMPLDPSTKRPLPWAGELVDQARPAAAPSKTTIEGSSQEPGPPSRGAAAEKPLRVACMGDSLTHSGGKDSYPAKLAELLGAGHNVRGFGAGGTTLLAAGDTPYRESGAYRDAMKFAPQIAVVMLGTNDTCGPPRGNWEKSAAFAGDAAALLRSLARPGRRVIVALPPPMVHDRPGLRPERAADLRERAPRLATIRNWWRQEAAKLDIEVVDLSNVFDSDPRWTTDGVHPTPAGYQRIADRIAETIRAAKVGSGETTR
jgi:lysophospholipase L1-like esterase